MEINWKCEASEQAIRKMKEKLFWIRFKHSHKILDLQKGRGIDKTAIMNRSWSWFLPYSLCITMVISFHYNTQQQRRLNVIAMTSPSNMNPKPSKGQKVKDTLKLPFKALAGATSVLKTSTYTAFDGADALISSIQHDNDANNDDGIQTVPSSVLRTTQAGGEDESGIDVLGKVGNVTLTTKQTLKAVNPINLIGSGLKGVQSVFNIVYDMQDAMEDAELRKESAASLGKLVCLLHSLIFI